jgi:hypothetical protein
MKALGAPRCVDGPPMWLVGLRRHHAFTDSTSIARQWRDPGVVEIWIGAEAAEA